MRYGVPYQGSKSRIAPWVVGNLPSSHTLVDLFAGGCAVTHAALLSGKWGRIVANDISDAPKLFIDAAHGKYAGCSFIPSRMEFEAMKGTDPYVRLCFSFGNNGVDYLYSREVEGLKVTASRMLTAPTLDERYRLYRRFVRLLLETGRPVAKAAEVETVERLEALNRLQSLQSLQILQILQILQSDYRSVPVPEGATVYADPPYRGTDCGCYGGFDFAAFDAWLASTEFPVWVSEYTCPPGCVEVASTRKISSMAMNGKGQRVVERLFVQERFADEAARGRAEQLALC